MTFSTMEEVVRSMEQELQSTITQFHEFENTMPVLLRQFKEKCTFNGPGDEKNEEIKVSDDLPNKLASLDKLRKKTSVIQQALRDVPDALTNMMSKVTETEIPYEKMIPDRSMRSVQTGPKNSPLDKDTKGRLHGIFLVHSQRDVDSDLYKDVISLFEKDARLSVVPFYHAYDGMDISMILSICSFTLCLLTPNFVNDPICQDCCREACTRTRMERDESVSYVKAKGFPYRDIPAPLKPITGIDHSSPYFKYAFRNTFLLKFVFDKKYKKGL